MSKKILIVDDEAHIRMLIEQTLEDLEDEGVEFLSADNGESALEMIQAEKPNLVFLDVMMPKMNGMEVCSRVKKTIGHERSIHHPFDGQGPGIGQAKRTGSRCGYLHDKTL